MAISPFSLGVLLVLLRVSRSVDYSDLEAVGVFCPERDSCARIHRDGGPETRNCECDTDCWSYGDCCVDAPYRRPRPSSGDRKENVVCLNYGQDNHTGIYVVARCSSGWNGPRKIRHKCEGSPDWSDPESAVPVTHVAQSVTYKNLFCAKCNDAGNAQSLQAFQIRLACEGGLGDPPLTPHYDQRRATWVVHRSDGRGNRTSVPCNVTFELPDPLKASVRFCRINVVSECTEDWTDRTTRLRCGRYTAVVRDGTGRTYRNPHCALCNHRKLKELTCGGRRKRSRPGKRPLSFTFFLGILLDLQRKDISGASLVHKSPMRRCPALHKYDSYFRRCRKHTCALPNYEPVDGTCVPKRNTS